LDCQQGVTNKNRSKHKYEMKKIRMYNRDTDTWFQWFICSIVAAVPAMLNANHKNCKLQY